MRRASKVDANQKAIVHALRLIGASVESLHQVGKGVPDLLVGFRGQMWLLEVKNPDGRNRVHMEQTAWHDAWQGPEVLVVRSVDEAVEAVEAIT